MQKQTITYYSEGHVIVGDLYLPDGLDLAKKHPAILQCQGFTGIRDMVQPEFARYFTDAGYVALAIDYRGWGDSGGERGRLAPLEQVDDVRNGLTWLETRDFVDPDRLGIFGASFGALIAPYVAALDARVKAHVGMVGVSNGYEAVTNKRTPAQMREWEIKVAEARRRRVLSNEVDRTLRVMDVFVDEQSMAWEPAMWEAVPKWRNYFGFDSIGRVMDFRPVDLIHKVAPRASGMIIANNDDTGSPVSYRELFDAAREPKQLFAYDCGHYDMYAGELMDKAMADAVGFFRQHLRARP
ncbi:alpha/beta hydrolase [Sinimarinibacterium flocculans]|uniref:alpha/beta hydrolase n=1 Tax=Sinimarinibacterium flocculans TaxID=985250 RepID=UPI0024902500|nr:alpha/beta fold hydrolase [Sinimarinibacterium flocculans]